MGEGLGGRRCGGELEEEGRITGEKELLGVHVGGDGDAFEGGGAKESGSFEGVFAGIDGFESNGDEFLMVAGGVKIGDKDLGGGIILGGNGRNPVIEAGDSQRRPGELVEELESVIAGFGLIAIGGMGDDTPAGGFVGAGGGAVDNFESKETVNSALKMTNKREKVHGREIVVVGGVGVRKGTGFGNKSLDIKVLGVAGNNGIKFFDFVKVTSNIGRVFVPGDKIETEVVGGSNLKESFHPIGVEGGGGRAADKVVNFAGTDSDGFGGVDI